MMPDAALTATKQQFIRLVDNTWCDTGKAMINNWLGIVYRLTNLDRHKRFMDGIDTDDPLSASISMTSGDTR